jgi:hypothetical protein
MAYQARRFCRTAGYLAENNGAKAMFKMPEVGDLPDWENCSVAGPIEQQVRFQECASRFVEEHELV